MRWSPTPSEANASAGEEDANSISNDVDAEWMKYCPILVTTYWLLGVYTIYRKSSEK
jgi:hypothetical protein